MLDLFAFVCRRKCCWPNYTWNLAASTSMRRQLDCFMSLQKNRFVRAFILFIADSDLVFWQNSISHHVHTHAISLNVSIHPNSDNVKYDMIQDFVGYTWLYFRVFTQNCCLRTALLSNYMKFCYLGDMNMAGGE